MTEAELKTRIMIYSVGDCEPKITSEDLDMIVNQVKMVDKYGVLPTEATWENTYNVNLGISLAWQLKAGRTADRYLFMTGGKMFSRNQYYDHCLKQAKYFASKGRMLAERLGPEQLQLQVPVPTNT